MGRTRHPLSAPRGAKSGRGVTLSLDNVINLLNTHKDYFNGLPHIGQRAAVWPGIKELVTASSMSKRLYSGKISY
jgi:hypothetical protein